MDLTIFSTSNDWSLNTGSTVYYLVCDCSKVNKSAFDFHHNQQLQDNSAADDVFCQKIENLYNWMDNLWIQVENIVAKGEIARFEQFLLLILCFQKAVCCRGVRKSLYEGKGYWSNSLKEFNMTQMISTPTRVTDWSSTLIEHLYTNKSERIIEMAVPSLAHSDHFLIRFTRKIYISDNKNAHTEIPNRDFQNVDRQFIVSLIKISRFLFFYKCYNTPTKTLICFHVNRPISVLNCHTF